MDQVSIKYTKIFPNLDFWFENKPSGNPEFKPYKLQQGRKNEWIEISV
jgi:hypothetical protein